MNWKELGRGLLLPELKHCFGFDLEEFGKIAKTLNIYSLSQGKIIEAAVFQLRNRCAIHSKVPFFQLFL
jgi:hypothetical protein